MDSLVAGILRILFDLKTFLSTFFCSIVREHGTGEIHNSPTAS
jgi:hypothetical protein